MLKNRRQELLTKHIDQNRSADLLELSKLLNVSTHTIRRDIRELSNKGLLEAVRGGAIGHSPIPHHYRERENLQKEQKAAVAQKALQHLRNGLVVFFDGGTTSLAVARAVPKGMQLTVVTNSFPVVNAFEDYPLIEVIFLGGRLHKKSFTTVGVETVDALRAIYADLAFLGICSIHLDAGITTIDYDDALLKKNIIANSKRIIALATADKLQTAEPFFVGPIDAIDIILIDENMPTDLATEFRKNGVDVR